MEWMTIHNNWDFYSTPKIFHWEINGFDVSILASEVLFTWMTCLEKYEISLFKRLTRKPRYSRDQWKVLILHLVFEWQRIRVEESLVFEFSVVSRFREMNIVSFVATRYECRSNWTNILQLKTRNIFPPLGEWEPHSEKVKNKPRVDKNTCIRWIEDLLHSFYFNE